MIDGTVNIKHDLWAGAGYDPLTKHAVTVSDRFHCTAHSIQSSWVDVLSKARGKVVYRASRKKGQFYWCLQMGGFKTNQKIKVCKKSAVILTEKERICGEKFLDGLLHSWHLVHLLRGLGTVTRVFFWALHCLRCTIWMLFRAVVVRAFITAIFAHSLFSDYSDPRPLSLSHLQTLHLSDAIYYQSISHFFFSASPGFIFSWTIQRQSTDKRRFPFKKSRRPLLFASRILSLLFSH